MTPLITVDGEVVCRADRAPLLRVERLHDHALTRLCAVFVCGHRAYPEPPTQPRVIGVKCTNCGEPKVVDGHRKCERCRACLRPRPERADPGGHGHSASVMVGPPLSHPRVTQRRPL